MLNIHFLNVGKGNCTIIDFPSGNLTMMDIDNLMVNNQNKLTDPIEYYKDNFDNQQLFRFILSHPDMDHMSGLSSFVSNTSITNFWDTNNNKSLNEEDWKESPYNKDDWDKYQDLRRSAENPKTLNLGRNATSDCCWVEDGIEILSPSKDLVELANESEEYNHLSYVLMVKYAGKKVLL